jgi:hypothetical protein
VFGLHYSNGSSNIERMAYNARPSSLALLAQASSCLAEAARASDPGERFSLSHLAGLRTAAAVVAERGRPASTRRRLISVWVLLDSMAPELSEWSAFFAAGAPLRAAVEAGAYNAVSQRQADDQYRAAGEFMVVVEGLLGMLAAPLAS